MSQLELDLRKAAWFAVHDAMPAGWLVGPVTFDPTNGRYRVTARAPHAGRGQVRVTVSGTGETDVAALVDLQGRLTGMPRPADEAAKRAAINERLRQAFFQGAEAEAANRGQPMDEPTLRRVLRRYSGDL